MVKGSCLCNQVQYEITSRPKQINLCHCQMCQKFSGSAFGAFMFVPAEGFKVTKGQDKIKIFNSSDWAARSFCSNCGSSIEYIVKEETGLKFLAAGTLDDDPGISAHHHIFTADKADWFDIEADIPQFPDYECSVLNNIT